MGRLWWPVRRKIGWISDVKRELRRGEESGWKRRKKRKDYVEKKWKGERRKKEKRGKELRWRRKEKRWRERRLSWMRLRGRRRRKKRKWKKDLKGRLWWPVR